MAQLISAQSITRSHAWIAYRSIFLPSLRYSLSSTSFTRQELAIIQRSSALVLLSAMGFNRNMLLEFVFGPAYLGGVGLQHLYIEQGYLKATTCSRRMVYSSLRGFLADSQFTLEIVNAYTDCLRRVHDRILMDDALAGWRTRTVKYKRSTDAGYTSKSNAS
jgi:hypothetical protein